MTRNSETVGRAGIGILRRHLLSAMFGMTLMVPGAIFAQSAEDATASDQQQVTWHSVEVEDGVRIRYGTSGSGPQTMLLIHGYPETSRAWEKVVPLLVEAGYRVITPDYRGAGGSSKPMDGYDKMTLAADLAAVLESANVEGPVTVVGHDIGLMVGYAFARQFPELTSGFAAIDAPLPGTDDFDMISATGGIWHFHFQQADDIPEALTAGRERYYLEYFWNNFIYDTGAIDEASKEAYVAAYSTPGGMRAGFELYRSFPQDAEDNRAALERDGKIEMPVLAIAGEVSPVAAIIESTMQDVASDVTTVIIPESGHWVADENPEALADALIEFARTTQ
jgi:pimeloyl-ACP methyl ester carboxylesterase